jgi:hypothetical protein
MQKFCTLRRVRIHFHIPPVFAQYFPGSNSPKLDPLPLTVAGHGADALAGGESWISRWHLLEGVLWRTGEHLAQKGDL